MSINIRTYFVFITLTLLLAAGCSPVKYVAQDQHLLCSVKLKEKQKSDANEATDYILLKPNSKLLGLIRLRLQLNNLYKPTKTSWLAKKLKEIGEAPVLFKTELADKNSDQIKAYYFSMGYFDNQVSYKTKKPFVFRKKRLKLKYSIEAGKRYAYRKISLSSESPDLLPLLVKFQKASKLQKGAGYNAKQLSDSRKKLSEYIRNQGYYYFAEQYVFYEVDSAITGEWVDLKINIQNSFSKLDDTTLVNHKKYKIGEIYIRPDFSNGQKVDDTLNKDSYGGFHLVYKQLNYKPKSLTRFILFSPGATFNQKKLTNTYKQLSDLQGFSTINIQFKENPDSSKNLLDSHVLLEALPKQSFGVEVEGTHRVGNWGTALSFNYKNRNIFKGNELLEIKPSLAFETLNNISDDNATLFNTFEYGIETSLKFPRFLLPFDYESWVPKSYSPKTTISVNINQQQRKDFTRSLMQTTLGYRWREGEFKTHNINLIDITYIKLKEGALIDISKNPFLASLFSDQLITASAYQFVFNNQDINSLRNFSYFRAGLEWSGNILNLLSNSLALEQTENGTFTLFNSPYAQYLKLDLDYRHYITLAPEHILAFRTFIGKGFAYGNSEILPFGKQFFAGGANDIRAWTAYQLGPGSFNSDTVNFNTGDIKGTVNLEYRFKIAGNFRGAIFSDVGNIWNSIRSDESLESNFQLSNFHKQLAVGAGLGIRYDFGFFILRLDFAQQMRDPSVGNNGAWLFDEFTLKRTRLNLGLGYPF
ncbi:MAG: outer membrane protein assembly factor BamA [Candidatus Azotimanducaceae bacterium]|jgi:outer membrane protein assembly factor BamA